MFIIIAADKTVRIWNTNKSLSSTSSTSKLTTTTSHTTISSSNSINNKESTINNAEYVFEGHTQGVSDIAWSPDGQYVASASDDGTIRLWNIETVSTI